MVLMKLSLMVGAEPLNDGWESRRKAVCGLQARGSESRETLALKQTAEPQLRTFWVEEFACLTSSGDAEPAGLGTTPQTMALV